MRTAFEQNSSLVSRIPLRTESEGLTRLSFECYNTPSVEEYRAQVELVYGPDIGEQRSILSQGLHWFDRSRFARRKQSCDQPDGREHYDDRHIGQHIQRLHLVQETPYPVSCHHRQEKTHTKPGTNNHRALPQDQLRYTTPRCAERHAHADLAPPVTHQLRQYPVQSSNYHHNRKAGKRANQIQPQPL